LLGSECLKRSHTGNFQGEATEGNSAEEINGGERSEVWTNQKPAEYVTRTQKWKDNEDVMAQGSEEYKIRRIVSSGLLRRVALVRTDVSEEPGASFIRVTRNGEVRTRLAVTSNRRTLRRN
jgi:hypothetical protein